MRPIARRGAASFRRLGSPNGTGEPSLPRSEDDAQYATADDAQHQEPEPCPALRRWELVRPVLLGIHQV